MQTMDVMEDYDELFDYMNMVELLNGSIKGVLFIEQSRHNASMDSLF